MICTDVCECVCVTVKRNILFNLLNVNMLLSFVRTSCCLGLEKSPPLAIIYVIFVIYTNFSLLFSRYHYQMYNASLFTCLWFSM